MGWVEKVSKINKRGGWNKHVSGVRNERPGTFIQDTRVIISFVTFWTNVFNEAMFWEILSGKSISRNVASLNILIHDSKLTLWTLKNKQK